MKTNNYLGRHDENRGIIIFCLVFGVLLTIILGVTFVSNSDNEDKKGISSYDGLTSVIEKQIADVDNFELDGSKLILKGELKEKVTEAIIVKLQNVQLVFKDKNGDKYEFDTEYFISDTGIEFSSILEDEEESNIDLEKISNGEYFVLLRIKYESAKNENGYKYKYYTLRNNAENNNVKFNEMNIFFDSSDRVSSYLTIEY